MALNCEPISEWPTQDSKKKKKTHTDSLMLLLQFQILKIRVRPDSPRSGTALWKVLEEVFTETCLGLRHYYFPGKASGKFNLSLFSLPPKQTQ